MKIDITKVLLFIIVAILGWNLVSGLFNTKDKEKDLLREQLVQQSRLIKSGEGRYEKLLNDYHDQKSLLEELKSSNKDLYKDIQKSNEEIVALTKVVLKFEDKLDSLELNKPIDEVIADRDTLEFSYPNTTDPLIKHFINFNSPTSITSRWNFFPTPIDLVITETESGVFKTNLSTNPYLSIESLKVQTLPFKPKKVDNFGWSYGAGMWRGINNIGIDIYGGIRLKKYNILLRVQTSSTPQVGALILYNPN